MTLRSQPIEGLAIWQGIYPESLASHAPELRLRHFRWTVGINVDSSQHRDLPVVARLLTWVSGGLRRGVMLKGGPGLDDRLTRPTDVNRPPAKI